MQLIEEGLKNALDLGLNSTVPTRLSESIAYSLLAGGKRIRPRLTLATGELLGLQQATSLSIALSLEMIHCFTLIHDDLPCMDNDDFRRGKPSNHKKFDEATALLAGDGLVPLAIEIFLSCDPPGTNIAPSALRRGLSRLLTAIGPRGVIGGQAMESELGPHANLKDLRQMHRMKTGALFEAAVLIPCDLANLKQDSIQHQALERFAYELGLAFQVADDLSDHTNANSELNKSVLRFITAKEARETTCKNLEAVCDGLIREWGEQTTGPLRSIAREVLALLEAPA